MQNIILHRTIHFMRHTKIQSMNTSDLSMRYLLELLSWVVWIVPMNCLLTFYSLCWRGTLTNGIFFYSSSNSVVQQLPKHFNIHSLLKRLVCCYLSSNEVEVPDYDATPIYDIQKRHHRLNRHQYAMNSNEPYSYSVKSASRTPPHTHSNLNGSRSSANSNSGKKNENVYFNNNKKADMNAPCSISSPFSSSECYTDTGDDD